MGKSSNDLRSSITYGLGLHRFALCTVPTNAVQAGEYECFNCFLVVSAVEHYVAQGLTPDEILDKMEEFCEGYDILSFCENLIENNLKPIIDNLEDQLSPFICQIWGFCPDGTTQSPEASKYLWMVSNIFLDSITFSICLFLEH